MTDYLKFVEVDNLPRKTKFWRVEKITDGLYFGHVEWLPRWRQYVFVPSCNKMEEDIVWSHGCLMQLAEFLKNETLEHRGKKS